MSRLRVWKWSLMLSDIRVGGAVLGASCIDSVSHLILSSRKSSGVTPPFTRSYRASSRRADHILQAAHLVCAASETMVPTQTHAPAETVAFPLLANSKTYRAHTFDYTAARCFASCMAQLPPCMQRRNGSSADIIGSASLRAFVTRRNCFGSQI